ncbi:MAG: SPOR domain-containing protein [Halioglobus sp.]
MNEVLKQRLVGALILIALGVVFWPIIFVEPGDVTASGVREVPTRPVINTRPIAAPDKTGLREAAELESRKEAQRREDELAATQAVAAAKAKTDKLAEAANAPAKTEPTPVAVVKAKPEPKAAVTKTRTQAPQKPALDSEGVPIAWILQVASVSDKEKADALRASLLKLGYEAYTKKVYRSDKVLLRVYIGPKFERAKLEKMKPKVDDAFAVQSMIVRYIP